MGWMVLNHLSFDWLRVHVLCLCFGNWMYKTILNHGWAKGFGKPNQMTEIDGNWCPLAAPWVRGAVSDRFCILQKYMYIKIIEKIKQFEHSSNGIEQTSKDAWMELEQCWKESWTNLQQKAQTVVNGRCLNGSERSCWTCVLNRDGE